MLPHSAEQIPELEHIDLWESYVLGWEHKDDELCIDIEAVLLPEHHAYEKPTPDLWACYKKGRLLFKDVTSLEGYEELDAEKATVDASGEKDFGHIEEFQFTKAGDYVFNIEYAGSLKFKAKEV
ncbi:MAG: hypothetical protein JKY93_08525, partial [Gammaproteobacteria bacterium]|nr:hypothetical protein [Gammaproteobacteria bacterium]